MFKCPICNNKMNLPKCMTCNNEIVSMDGIYQFASDISIYNQEKNSINFDELAYSYSLEDSTNEPGLNQLIDVLDKIIGNETLFDLGCGDGFLTIPLLNRGKKIIAADISNQMLLLLKHKANLQNSNLNHLILTNMNAYQIMLMNNSIDNVICNGLFHLVSKPDLIVEEISRILKNEGKFIFLSDASNIVSTSKSYKEYNDITNWIYKYYFELLKETKFTKKKINYNYNIYPKLKSNFHKMETVKTSPIEYTDKIYIKKFIDKLKVKGFLEQVGVDNINHQEAFDKVMKEGKSRFGVDFITINYEIKKNISSIIDIYYK